MKLTPTLAIAICLASAAPAIASVVIQDQSINLRGTITADNHHAVYSCIAGHFTCQGGNELGCAGSLGGYNWTHAESHEFKASEVL